MSTKAQRLAAAVLHRREELELTQLEVSFAGGPSNSTLTNIENGRAASLPRSTARKLDAALKWEPGGARGVWEDGTEPVPLLTEAVSPKDAKSLREELAAEIETAELPDDLRAKLRRYLNESAG
jgi:transcriptional regulator with XRE-family HTH domain